ncbi:SDR family oxidoreductase [Streptomyces sp. PSAA01]|uniref:SDR family oxidoreductase n=1 Tax=Streptomyces sp. PSAA01 TaxID=2912762 RepID=UPI001F296A5F|nr:NAD(P)H-binding protein [Streptomyces sp. PSAA01]MCG0283543.1 NAD(P)H-binding protein [Streptomyces sp. PSAA01]
MRIAATTPTGNVGRHVVATLVRTGVRPRVLLRDPARLAPEVRDAVEAVPVDQYDADAVVAATTGIDALFWVNPASGSGDPLAEYDRATRSVEGHKGDIGTPRFSPDGRTLGFQDKTIHLWRLE